MITVRTGSEYAKANGSATCAVQSVHGAPPGGGTNAANQKNPATARGTSTSARVQRLPPSQTVTVPSTTATVALAVRDRGSNRPAVPLGEHLIVVRHDRP